MRKLIEQSTTDQIESFVEDFFSNCEPEERADIAHNFNKEPDISNDNSNEISMEAKHA